MLDLKITGGKILDGTGDEERLGDIGIRNGLIAEIGDLRHTEARTCFDAQSLYVCPGFIDAHSHSDAYLLIEPSAPSKVYQGITTEVTGNCGASAAPVRSLDTLPSDWRTQHYPRPWNSMREYLELLTDTKPAVNVVPLVGQGKVRSWVMDYSDRDPAPEDMAGMLRLLDECLDEGVFGMSTGLIYPPGVYSKPGEIAELAKRVAKVGGVYASHMRNEGSKLIESIEEIVQVARETGVRIQISHLKTAGKSNWGLIDRALELIDAARSDGIDVAADRYPYTASHTDLDIILPDWALEGGREAVLRRLATPAERKRIQCEIEDSRPTDYWPTVVIGSTTHPDNRHFQGCKLTEAAEALGMSPSEAALHLIEKDDLGTSAFFFGMSEENMWRILADPFVMPGSDASLRAPAGPLSQGHPHPRAYGTITTFLRASLDGKTVPLPEAIRKMTSLPARRFGIKNRGLIHKGYHADLVIFNPETLSAPSSWAQPHQLSRGIELLAVNGIVTIEREKLTGQRAGKVLTRNQP